jgi:hypothetical protein
VDIGFIVVASIGLALLSLMTVIRLTGVGVSWRRTALAVVELWAVIAAWVLLAGRGWITAVLPPLQDGKLVLAHWPAQLREMPPLWFVCDVLVVVVAAHFMWSLNRLRGEQAQS